MAATTTRGDSRFRRRRWRSRFGRALPYLIGFVAAALLGALGWLVFFSSVLGAHQVRVEGVQTVGADRIRQQAAVVEGEPLARLDTQAVVDRLSELPRIADAEVDRDWPRGVVVRVRERTTVAVVRIDGQLRGVDAEGVAYRRYDDPPAGVAMIELRSDGADEEVLAEAAAVIDALDPQIAKRVERVEVASVDAIEFVLGNGDRVRWGSADDSEQKAQVLATLLDVPASVYDVTAPEHPATSG